jgi:hypothetical protein
MPFRGRSVVVLVSCVAVLAACSSGKSKGSSATTSTSTSTTSTTASSTSTSAGGATTTSTAASATTTSGGAGSVRISGFSGPNEPLQCNAPTSAQFSWTTVGATTVEMHIDGSGVFATYPNGARTELLPVTCDGGTHTYQLVAKAGSAMTSASITVQTVRR